MTFLLKTQDRENVLTSRDTSWEHRIQWHSRPLILQLMKLATKGTTASCWQIWCVLHFERYDVICQWKAVNTECVINFLNRRNVRGLTGGCFGRRPSWMFQRSRHGWIYKSRVGRWFERVQTASSKLRSSPSSLSPSSPSGCGTSEALPHNLSKYLSGSSLGENQNTLRTFSLYITLNKNKNGTSIL